MGRAHLAACNNSDSVQVTAVADTSDEACRQMAAAGLTCYSDARELIAAGEVDAVIIATPTPTHQDLTTQALAAGLPVLCEKPCGPTAAGLRRLATGSAAGPAFRVGYWRRFVPHLNELRGQIANGELGILLTLETGQWDGQPPSPQYQRDCGTIFADMAVHDLDEIQWLAAERIATVRSAERAGTAGAAAGQAALCVLTLDSGLLAAASMGRWFPVGDACWIRAHGTTGFRELHFLTPPDSDGQMAAAVQSQDEAFADLVRGCPDERLATAEDAAAALAAAEAAAACAVAIAERRIDGASI